jgi:hypothetical protein
LEPQFLRRLNDTHWKEVDTLKMADGIQFLCPKCLRENNMSSIGVHSVVCWEPQVPPTMKPGPGRWEMTGKGYNDLTLTAGSSSIFLNSEGACQAHFFITNGEITFT